MAQASPMRRALVDLPVNTFGTPSAMSAMRKQPTSQKRELEEVEDVEFSQPKSRVCLSPQRSASTLRVDSPQEEGRPEPSASNTDHYEHIEEMGDGDSQNSFRGSLSSLVDFDPDETLASQQTAATELTQPSPSRISRHAETLRLRLRLAHFKVQTNQTNIPLSQLQMSRNRSEDQLLSSERDFGSDQPSLPRLLPAPILRPTAYSARTTKPPPIPSSPPSSANNSPAKAACDEVFRTPALSRHAAHVTLEQTSSPPDSQERRKRCNEDDSLTSSAVRGKAAIGLLGLRKER